MKPTYQTISKQYRLFSILLPIINVLALVTSVFAEGRFTPFVLIVKMAFVLGFDFFIIYFTDTRQKLLSAVPYAIILIILTPAVIFIASGLLNELSLGLICLICFVLLGSTVDYYLNIVIMIALMLYCELFYPGTAEQLLPSIVMTLVITTLFEKKTKGTSLIYSILIPAISYLILSIINAGFVITNVFTIDNVIFLTVSVVLICSCYFILEHRIPDTAMEDIIPVLDDINIQPPMQTEEVQSGNNLSSEDDPAETEHQNEDEEPEVDDHLLEDRIKELEISLYDAENEITDLQTQLTELSKRRIATTSEMMSAGSPFSLKLRNDSRRLYKHCTDVAKLSSKAAELISCDGELAYILGLYHESARFLGDSYEDILMDEFHLPEYIVRKITQLCNKSNSAPLTREAGIVLLTDDIFNVINYVTSKNKEDISIERIVNNTIKVRKDQNMLRLAGFSNEEIQLLKLYFIDAGGNYDTDN